MTPAPQLSICVCTHNRPDYLATCLAGLKLQTIAHETLDIIIVDSASAPEPARRIQNLVANVPNVRLVRLDQPGLCPARNTAAEQARAEYIAFLDDDAVPAPDWAANALQALREANRPALLGGRILPAWEKPLPDWWPAHLRGVLSIVEADGAGEYNSPALPPGLEPCGANLIVHVPTLKAIGGFWTKGRCGNTLLSDDEVQLAARLREAGYSTRYDSRVVVHHTIQVGRMTPQWLLARLYWQGISAVLSRRLLGNAETIWRELPRRLALAFLLAPCWLLPRKSPAFIALRWRAAYAIGFTRAALNLRTAGLF